MSLLRAWRQRRKLTQEQLEELSGVDQGTISGLESSDQPNPTVRTANLLAAALRCRVEDLFPIQETAVGGRK
jgi:transcriptional regulator with XRE-family HTH domain